MKPVTLRKYYMNSATQEELNLTWQKTFSSDFKRVQKLLINNQLK